MKGNWILRSVKKVVSKHLVFRYITEMQAPWIIFIFSIYDEIASSLKMYIMRKQAS